MTQPSEINRRDFLKRAGVAVAASSLVGTVFAAGGERVEQNKVLEKSFRASSPYRDPFHDVEFKVRITFPDGREQTYPGYWAGGDVFKFRFSSHEVGEFSYVTLSSNPGDAGLHQQRGTFRVVRYTGDNLLLKHGPIRVSADKRHFTHLDGTPFLWLGDTWWCGMTKRLAWPDEFKLITEDRRQKDYNVIQFTAGLAPSGTYFDQKNVNEAGLPWDEASQSVNPAYFDAADQRVFHLVSAGMVPVVVPCWGFYVLRMGTGPMKKFWAYIMARWGALPAVWCLAGELSMPYYTSETPEDDARRQREEWQGVLEYVREINCWGHLVTIHPRYGSSAKAEALNPAHLDFDMLQTGHMYLQALPKTLTMVRDSRASQPVMPALVDEVAYEGIAETNWEDCQRQLFWASVLSGSPGFTYGAHGITQFNSPEHPSHVQPQGLSWGEAPWKDSMHYRGSRQVGVGKKVLESLNWPGMEPHPEWLEPGNNPLLRHFVSYAAGIPGRLRVIYFSSISPMNLKVLKLEPGVVYDAHFVVPSSGKKLPVGKVHGDDKGVWTMTRTRKHDLLLVLTAGSETASR